MVVPSGRKPEPKPSSAAPGKAGPSDKQPAVAKEGGVAQPKAPSGKAPSPKTIPVVRALSDRAAKPVSSRRAGTVEIPAAAGGTLKPKGLIWVICRECSEEWAMDPSKAQRGETIACPLCEHRAQAPSDDILHQIALYKGIERKNLTAGVFFFALGLAAMVLWVVVTASPDKAAEPALFYGPIFVGVLSLVLTVVFGYRYESSRWETYF